MTGLAEAKQGEPGLMGPRMMKPFRANRAQIDTSADMLMRAAPTAASYGLMALLAFLSARMFWMLVAPLPVPSSEITPAISQSQAPRSVVAKSPFGNGEVVLAAVVEKAPDVEETSLDLTLTGVWAEGENGSALIELPNGKQRRFRVDEEILDGVTLQAVYYDQVTIQRAGVREALRFETKDYSEEAASQSGSLSTQQNGRDNLAAAQAPINANLRAGRGERRANQFANVGFANFLRVTPGRDSDGNPTIELYSSRDRSTFEAFGLRDGDRLLTINGNKPPSNAAALSSVLANLQRSTGAKIVIKRGDREIPLNISLSALNN